MFDSIPMANILKKHYSNNKEQTYYFVINFLCTNVWLSRLISADCDFRHKHLNLVNIQLVSVAFFHGTNNNMLFAA